MKKIILTVFFIVLMIGGAQAQDASYETGKGKTSGKEQSIQHRSSGELSSSADIKLSIDAIFIPILADLEKKDKTFKACNIISKPKLPGDFGLTSSTVGGYDLIIGQYLDQQAKSSGQAPSGLIKYRNCMAFYGAVVAQAHLNLVNMLPGADISLDDLQTLARITVEKTFLEGFKDNVRKLYDYATKDTRACRFKQSLDSYQCGVTNMSLSLQKLSLGSTELWGDKYYGYTGEYRISQSSKKSKELVMSQKKSWDLTKKNHHTVSPSKLLPKIN